MSRFTTLLMRRFRTVRTCWLAGCLCAAAHSGKARFHVLIDTDGAADDLRTICMLLGNREVEVLSVTASEGALTPAGAARQATALLRHFHHEGIPVGTGRLLGVPPPAWRSHSEAACWGDTACLTVSPQQAADLLVRTIENEDERVTVVCLGTLTNLHDALEGRPELKERIERVIWYSRSAQPLQGANYDADPVSAGRVLASGIPVRIISANRQHPLPVDGAYLEAISGIEGEYARHIVRMHGNGAYRPAVASGHMQAWDDWTAVYLFAPELFDSVAVAPAVSAHRPADAPSVARATDAIVRILTGRPDSESRVFCGFPEDPGLYAGDVAPAVRDAIARHGRSEWRAGVLANELHGHLGIYAIVGVKMGIRAREYFNIGVDDIEVTSYAGLQPPVSCLNDGLQVSTGATLGHGLIRVPTDRDVRPEATFAFKGRTLRLKLKPAYAQQIRRDVEEGIRLHGNLTEAYWMHVRTLALRYWQTFDRHELFEMQEDGTSGLPVQPSLME
ncbi:MAG: nucleoside hydrolase [Tannerella sp.]|jgi:pyrimidine-specific ribonucleoside hydrolase|nr:nucleoside hydrolase [Tannerella sp.]